MMMTRSFATSTLIALNPQSNSFWSESSWVSQYTILPFSISHCHPLLSRSSSPQHHLQVSRQLRRDNRIRRHWMIWLSTDPPLQRAYVHYWSLTVMSRRLSVMTLSHRLTGTARLSTYHSVRMERISPSQIRTATNLSVSMFNIYSIYQFKDSLNLSKEDSTQSVAGMLSHYSGQKKLN